jgi:mannitol/fructose-specific phosphotransferase system IIA component (Ntr-type)
VVQQGLAIPHVIVDQPGSFDVCLLRCKEGVVFSELQPPVTAMFALIGSRDERSFHLKALLAIAHVVQSEGFKDRWIRAKNPEQLRDIVLLADRPRQPAE